MIEQLMRDGVPPAPEPWAACPVCHRDDQTERLATVIRKGTGYVLMTETNETRPFVSQLAHSVRPPEAPHPMTYGAALLKTVLSLLIGAAVIVLVLGLGAINELGLPGRPLDRAIIAAGVWFGFIVPAALFWRADRQIKAAARELPVYRTARSRWERSFYCNRDDVVFIPDENVMEHPDHMSKLLYRPTDLTQGTAEQGAL